VNPRNFFAELKRRNVMRMAGLYLVGAWLLVQVAGTVLPMFGAPEWLPRSVVVLLAIGFAPALVFSWVFELTPQGLKRDEEVAPEQSIAPQTARRMDRMIIVVLGLALAYFGFDKFVLNPQREAALVAAATQSHAMSAPNEPRATANTKSIAVLPFENLSDDKSAAYFADGIQDEILTKLAGVADLKVISRTSTAKYKSKPEDLKTVSQQLGVANILEGSVQKAGDKVRVNVQLIDARADSHLWAKSYDRDIKDVFTVESEVAQEIADSLQAKLSPAEATTLTKAPTADTVAYELFLKGEYELRGATTSLKPQSFDQAATWYQQAIEHDPNFALAYAKLAECRMNRHWFVQTFTEPELAEVRRIAQQAQTLAPDLAQGHVALGIFYYFAYRDYEKALVEFHRAIELQPNNAAAIEYSGYVHRRQGQWQSCLNEMNKALQLDPRSADVAGNLGQTYALLRMWPDAERVSRHAVSLDPYDVIGMRALLLSILNAKGDVQQAQTVLSTFPPDNKIIIVSIAGDAGSVTGERAYTFVMARNFEQALKVWEPAAANSGEAARQPAARSAIRVISGDLSDATSDAEKAVQLLEERLRQRPDELVSMRQLAWSYLALKRNDDAVRIARRSVDVLPPERDALLGAANLAGLAQVEAHTGAAADAIAILRRLLSVPAGESVSIARLKVDPVWDPIRRDPGFQQLLTMQEHVGP
jgi:TolB-like protein/Tfp pilus assembly protein PilF